MQRPHTKALLIAEKSKINEYETEIILRTETIHFKNSIFLTLLIQIIFEYIFFE